MPNPILEEIYAIREKLSEMPRDELAALLRAEFEAAKRAGHPIAKIKQRSIRRAAADTTEEHSTEVPTPQQQSS